MLSGLPAATDYGSCQVAVQVAIGASVGSQGYTINVSRQLNGTLDTTFNVTGYELLSPSDNVEPVASGVDSAGRLVILSASTQISIRRYTKGSLALDSTFAGISAYLPFDVLTNAYLAFDDASNIYAAAIGYNTVDQSHPFAVISKYKVADGSLDTAYGSSGTRIVKFSTYTGYNDDLYAGIQCAGDGTCYVFGSSETRIAIAKLSPVGGFVSTFGNGSGIEYDYYPAVAGSQSSTSQLTALSFSPAGALNAGASYSVVANSALFQLNSTSGLTAPSFGTGGSSSFDLISGSTEEIFQLITLSTGSIFGFVTDNPIMVERGLWPINSSMAVKKFTPFGAVDTGFSQVNLNYSSGLGGSSVAGGIAVDAYNGIVYTLATNQPGGAAGSSKINITASDAKTGAPVSSFGASGTLVLDLTSATSYNWNFAHRIYFDGYGRLLILLDVAQSSAPNMSATMAVVVN